MKAEAAAPGAAPTRFVSLDGTAVSEPTVHRVRAVNAGILTFGEEDLVLEPVAPTVGAAVCVRSGGRLAYRRVLAVDGTVLRLRGDVAPFEDRWDGEIVGCVRPRLVDKLATTSPELFTRSNWLGALLLARALSARKRLVTRKREGLRTRVLDASEWPTVRSFWREACGDELHVEAQPHQHVVGLFDGERLVGANIHLVFGTSSYSAYTLVERDYRGSGGGIAMIERAMANARTLGLESVYVHINARNFPSIRAYRRAGFEPRGWWSDASDPMAAAERQWRVFEMDLRKVR